MIYVIKSAAFNKDYTKFKIILKIGYSDDMSFSRRILSYRLCNPTCQVIYKLPNGTKDDERSLHRYFKKYLYKDYGHEWFEENKEIYDFFDKYKTIEQVREVVPLIVSFAEKRKRLEDKIKLWPIVFCIKEVTGILDYSIYEECNSIEENTFVWIRSKYCSDSEKIINLFLERKTKITLEINTFIEYLRNPKNGHISKRLKELCETNKYTDEEKSFIAQQVSEKFDQYYNLVGPEKCAKFGYNITYIKTEISNLKVSEEDIKIKFMSEFKVGDRISNARAKEKVRQIYYELGLNKSPKAIDIRDYFNIKKQKIKDVDRGRGQVNGLEIIGIK